MAKAPPKVGAPKAKRTPWQGRTASKRVHMGRALQRERAKLFADDPLCQDCKKAGRVTVATIRDHIVPLAQGGKDERENTQGLCIPCHDVKTKQESVAGRRAGGFQS